MLINPYERDQFKFQYSEYLEELFMEINHSIDPEMIENFEEYNKYFHEDPNHIPFKIYNPNPNADFSQETLEYVGFFFLHLTTTAEFPEQITPIFTENEDLACLNHLYILPTYRHQSNAWRFFDSILQFCNENHWNIVWESDIRNSNAIAFYNNLFSKVQKESEFRFKIDQYLNCEHGNVVYNFYQLQLVN